MDRFINALKGHAGAQAGALGQPRMGIVTSYNPDEHTAKVSVQPEGVLTGWLPVSSLSVGSGWGLHFPLKTGEQVVVIPQDGDGRNGVIIGRLFSDKMRPPASGGADFVLKSSGGAVITMMPSGTLELKDAAGAIVKLTNDGNMSLTAPNTLNIHCEALNVQASVSATIQSPFTNVSNELDVGTGPIKQNGITVIVP